jgi:hypothetical protein
VRCAPDSIEAARELKKTESASAKQFQELLEDSQDLVEFTGTNLQDKSPGLSNVIKRLKEEIAVNGLKRKLDLKKNNVSTHLKNN